MGPITLYAATEFLLKAHIEKTPPLKLEKKNNAPDPLDRATLLLENLKLEAADMELRVLPAYHPASRVTDQDPSFGGQTAKFAGHGTATALNPVTGEPVIMTEG